MWRGGMSIEIKTPEQLAVMREAGLVVARTLDALAAAVKPGVTTAELDELAEAEIRAAGATPSFKGYHGYPAVICTSVNEEIVHGIPSSRRILRDGDIISIDCGAIVRGWHGDAARTVGVGTISAEHASMLQVCEAALWQGLAQARAGGRLGDISHAVEASVAASGSYGHRADGDARRLGDRPARRRLDGHHRRRELGRALRAHGRDHPGRAVGADRGGRRQGGAGPGGGSGRVILGSRTSRSKKVPGAW
jgi:methionine aminopeptidase